MENGCFGFFFLGECPSLDNCCTGAAVCNSPRQVGFVKYSKDLKKCCTPDGCCEKGGYYCSKGVWREQCNDCVCWVTNMKNSCNKLKVIRGKNGCFLLIFETWNRECCYCSTFFILMDKNGCQICEPQELVYPIRLLRADDPSGCNIVVGDG